jgi:hypothetical protein
LRVTTAHRFVVSRWDTSSISTSSARRRFVEHVPQHPVAQRRIRSQDVGDSLFAQRLAGVRWRGFGPQAHERITGQPA